MKKYGRNCCDGGGGGVMEKTNSLRRPKLGALLRSEPAISINREETNYSFNHRNSNASTASPAQIYNRSPMSGDSSPSPYFMSPWNQTSSPYTNSPWIRSSPLIFNDDRRFLIGSLLREEGHIYALAASGDLLYTGSDSKNIRVWKNLKDFSGFKSNSGLVKAIVISGEKIFTGHQDGKIRVWKLSPKKNYKRVGSLPTTRDFIKSSFNPKNYVEVRRHRNVPWIKHFDAVSCMSLDKDRGLLYSGSWDKTMKVWRIRDSKCLESVNAHNDAVNSVVVAGFDDAVNSVVVAGFDGLVLTGSADGTVKVWRKELMGRKSKHVLVRVLLKQENAVTALAVNVEAAVIYGGASDGLVNFWEREKHLCHGGVLRGHKMAVLCLATAGNMVFSGSADKSICVWRRDKGGDHTCLSVLTGHCGPVKCLAVEEDHDHDQDDEASNGDDDQRWIVYSGSLDKSVKVWRMSDHVVELK